MFLKSLSLKGFKSFADPAVLEFEPGVTVVVGPNGSGKSNVVDAVAWVLGAQGPRTVRSAKMEDVIFMGTANRAALGRAEVALTIDNSSGRLPTDLAEITITRTLFRSGDSEYSINGTPCRLLDIQELLSDTGVGRQQHVIISQGHLGAILEARPEDRRSVIEEAAGVLKFRRRRERSERRLAATEDNLERLFDLVREVKRQIRPLERQAAAARSFGGLTEELRAVRLYVAGTELRSLDARGTDALAAKAAQAGTESTLRSALVELDADSERTAGELSLSREGDLTASLGRTEGLVERARGLGGVLRERQRSISRALDAAADADVVSTLEAEGARLAEELAEAETQAVDLDAERAPLDAREAAVVAELEAHQAARGMGADLRDAEEAVTVARGQLASLEHALERDRRSLDQLSARLASTERRSAQLEGEDHELGERLAETEQARHQLQARVAAAENAHQLASGRLEAAEDALRQAEGEMARSVARADALERTLDEARGAAGAEMLAGVDGVVGTLLDLVEVDAGWEEAFEAAAGASVAAMVVSGSDAARSALTRLRQGGATGAVLALSGLEGGLPTANRAPEGTETVRAHVRPRAGRESFAGLEHLLDTLLADACCARGGWSEAIDLALSRPDLVVVTREGDRFSSSGWRVRASGGVVTGALVEEARARADLATEAAGQAAEARTSAQAEVQRTRDEATDARRAADRNEVAYQTARAARTRVANDRAPLASELEEVARNRVELDERIARDMARVAELTVEIPDLEQARNRQQEKAAAIREVGRQIESRLVAIRAERNEFEVRLAGVTERRRVLNQRLVEVERRLTGHVEERLAAAERRRRLEADALAVERLLVVVTEAQSTVETSLQELRAGHRRQLEAVRAGGERLETLRKERFAREQEITAAQQKLQQIEMDLVEISIRREAVVEALRREQGSGPEEALAAPEPELPEGVQAESRMVQLEAELAALGPVNPLALEELNELNERHQFLEAQVEDVRKARRELHQVIRTLDEEIMTVFDQAFADVNDHFSALVSSLFPGGTGRLSLTDPENLLNTGVEVEVRPAGRNVRRLSLLSGGERSLVALAFLFAVFRSRPSPFYLMDEVEAALDDVNLMRFLGLVDEFRGEAQLIIVSHQKRTMEAADALYGVTMAPGGSSKVVSQKVARRLPGSDEADPSTAGVDPTEKVPAERIPGHEPVPGLFDDTGDPPLSGVVSSHASPTEPSSSVATTPEPAKSALNLGGLTMMPPPLEIPSLDPVDFPVLPVQPEPAVAGEGTGPADDWSTTQDWADIGSADEDWAELEISDPVRPEGTEL